MDKDLFTFVSSWNLIDPTKIDLATRIESDLGLTGDDAIDFIQEFSKLFNVDSSSLNFEEYFIPEGVSTYWYSDQNRPKDMTLDKLQEALSSGKLT